LKTIIEKLKQNTVLIEKSKISVNEEAMEVVEIADKQRDDVKPSFSFSLPSNKNLQTKTENILETDPLFVDTNIFNHSHSGGIKIDLKRLEGMELSEAIEFIIGVFYGKAWGKVNKVRLKKQLFGNLLKGDDVIPYLEINKLPIVELGDGKSKSTLHIALISSLIYSSFRREYGFCSKKDDLSLLLLLISFSARNLRR
jgi:hypothetical protein